MNTQLQTQCTKCISAFNHNLQNHGLDPTTLQPFIEDALWQYREHIRVTEDLLSFNQKVKVKLVQYQAELLLSLLHRSKSNG